MTYLGFENGGRVRRQSELGQTAGQPALQHDLLVPCSSRARAADEHAHEGDDEGRVDDLLL